MRHLLTIDDLTSAELRQIIDISKRPLHTFEPILKGAGAACIFAKASLRTRNSTELAIAQLGGHPITINDTEIGLDKREKIEDVGRVLAGYHNLLALRVFDHGQLERLAALESVPIVNLLSDVSHPLQALADVLTIEEEFGSVAGKKVVYIGDANNVTRSLVIAVGMLGGEMLVITPEDSAFSEEERTSILATGVSMTESTKPEDAVSADVIYTDTWFSMGDESLRASKLADFTGFSVDENLMARNESAIVLHCLPAYRGEEISAAVLEGPQSRVWKQAHNRLPAVRAAIYWILKEVEG